MDTIRLPPYAVSSQQIQIKVAQNRLKKKKKNTLHSLIRPPRPSFLTLILDSQADTSLFALNSISAKLISQSLALDAWNGIGGGLCAAAVSLRGAQRGVNGITPTTDTDDAAVPIVYCEKALS